MDCLATLMSHFQVCPILSCLILLPAAILLYTIYTNWRLRKLPPGPTVFPIFGTVLSLKGVRFYQHAAEYRHRSRLCNLMTHVVSGRPMIFINEMKKAKQIFQDLAEHTSEHFAFPALRLNNPHRNGIINSPGSRWIQVRRMSLQVLKELGFGKSKVEQSIKEQCDHLVHHLTINSGKPLDMSEILAGCTSDIVSMLLFNKKPFMDNAQEDMKYVSYVQQFMRSTFQFLIFFPFMTVLYKFKALRPFLPHTDRLDTDQQVIDYLRREIKKHRQEFDATTADKPRDFVEHFMYQQARGNEKFDPQVLEDENLVYILRDLFLAGTDTTSVTLCWLLALLCHRPVIQERVHQELHGVIGDSKEPSMSHLHDCGYTRAVISETLRYGVTAPSSLPHVAARDLTIDGFSIPKDSVLLLNIYALCRDASLWKNPLEFDPEHFYDPNTQEYVANDHLLSFGLGKRVCLGESLARQELFVFLANMLLKFRFSFSKKQDFSVEDILRGHLVGMVRSPKTFFVESELRE